MILGKRAHLVLRSLSPIVNKNRQARKSSVGDAQVTSVIDRNDNENEPAKAIMKGVTHDSNPDGRGIALMSTSNRRGEDTQPHASELPRPDPSEEFPNRAAKVHRVCAVDRWSR